MGLTGRSAAKRAKRQAAERIALIQRQSEQRTFAREAPVLARLESSAENFIAIQRQRGALSTKQEAALRTRASLAQGRVQTDIAQLPGTQVGGRRAAQQRRTAATSGPLVSGSRKDNGETRIRVEGTGKDRGTTVLETRPARQRGEPKSALAKRFDAAEAARARAIGTTEQDIAARGQFADGASQRRLIEAVNPGAISGPARRGPGPLLSAKENLKARQRQIAGTGAGRRALKAKRKGIGLSVPGSKDFLG